MLRAPSIASSRDFLPEMCHIRSMPFLPIFVVSAWLLVSYPDAGWWTLFAYLAFVAMRRR